METSSATSDAIASDPIPIERAIAYAKVSVAAADIRPVSIIRQSDESKIAAAQRLANTLTVGDAMNSVRGTVRPFLWTNIIRATQAMREKLTRCILHLRHQTYEGDATSADPITTTHLTPPFSTAKQWCSLMRDGARPD